MLGPGTPIQGQTPIPALIPADFPCQGAAKAGQPLLLSAGQPEGQGRPLYCPPTLELRRRALPASWGILPSNLAASILPQ